jgi:predicted deacylase
VIRRLGCPTPDELGDDADAWLANLGGAVRIDVPGVERGRSRALVTLLHGNEPSGFRALHGWLGTNPRPAVDLCCFVMSVGSALLEPRFTHRMPPGTRDLNRCFEAPGGDEPGRMAEALLGELRELAPEAIIDLHNTSGEGPAYGVTTRLDDARLALTSLFSSHLILTDLRLCSLMEATEDLCPTVTI